MSRRELILEFSERTLKRHGVLEDKKERVFTVTKIINSTAYNPGDEIDPVEVDRLCMNNGWKVSIIRKKVAA